MGFGGIAGSSQMFLIRLGHCPDFCSEDWLKNEGGERASIYPVLILPPLLFSKYLQTSFLVTFGRISQYFLTPPWSFAGTVWECVVHLSEFLVLDTD